MGVIFEGKTGYFFTPSSAEADSDFYVYLKKRLIT